MGEAVPASIDYARLSLFLRALAVANRLELLRILQVPHTVAEIALAPARRDTGRSPDRPLSRQAVEIHVQKLREMGLVQARASTRNGRRVMEYSVNLARLFVVADELRRLSLVPTSPGETVETRQQGGAPDPRPVGLPGGPALVVARGPFEGTGFPLAGPGPWVVGRDKGLAVPLHYDPFVSKENTRVWRDKQGFFVKNLRASRNGTQLNWRPLEPDEVAPLAPGDTLGVGRSLLLFRGA